MRKSRTMFKSSNDPARKYYGAGKISNSDEWNEIIIYLQKQDVKVSFVGKDMVYGVSAVKGQPGNLRIYQKVNGLRKKGKIESLVKR